MNTRELADQLVDPRLPTGLRVEAAQRLGQDGDPTVLWSLAAVLELEPTLEPIWKACVDAIETMDGVALMLDFLEQGEPEERLRAAAGIRHFPSTDVALRLVGALERAEDPTVRAYCVEGIARSENPSTLGALALLRSDEDPRVRRWASHGVARLEELGFTLSSVEHSELGSVPGPGTEGGAPMSKQQGEDQDG